MIKKTKEIFLVDIGAEVSILPRKLYPSLRDPTDFSLITANGGKISTLGIKRLTADFNLRRDFDYTFVVADIDHPILGTDFLYKFNLSVDLRTKKLDDNVTYLNVNG